MVHYLATYLWNNFITKYYNATITIIIIIIYQLKNKASRIIEIFSKKIQNLLYQQTSASILNR